MSMRLILMICATGLTAGCEIRGDFCDIASPILPSRDDVLTEGTTRQIVAHNETGERLCRWRP